MVDGVYDSDPKKNPDAVKYETVTFQTCLEKQLKVMDATAFSLCMENDIPIIVFDLGEEGNVIEAVSGKEIGTTVQL